MDFSRSLKYDKHIIWENESNTSPVELLVDKIIEEAKINFVSEKLKNYKIGLNNLICNLIRGIENGKLVAIWRTRSAYTMPRIYGMAHYTYNIVVGGTNLIKSLGYAEIKIGYFDKNKGSGKITRIWGTEKLVNKLNELSSISCSLSENISTYFDENAVNTSSLHFRKILYDNPIILKKSKPKIKINYKPTKKTNEMKNFIFTYNDYIKNFDVILPVQSNEYTNIRLKMSGPRTK